MPLDLAKDQTYFLHSLDQKQLSNVIFPLSDITKQDVKKIAEVNSFKSFNKKESMGICFIGNKKFKNFIKNYIKNSPGKILDFEGNIIGEHDGIFYATIGQREGIGIGGIKIKKIFLGMSIKKISKIIHYMFAKETIIVCCLQILFI